MLRMTHEALVNSLLRYGLTILGSCMPEDLVNTIDVCVVNPAASRITGLGSHTRIETLHFLAGTLSYRNLYVCHTASFLHSTLLAQGGQVQGRLQREIGAHLAISSAELQIKEVK